MCMRVCGVYMCVSVGAFVCACVCLCLHACLHELLQCTISTVYAVFSLCQALYR